MNSKQAHLTYSVADSRHTLWVSGSSSTSGSRHWERTDQRGIRWVAQFADRTDEQLRIMVLEFLETDIFTLSTDHAVTFLGPLIGSWDIDLATFSMEIVLNPRLVVAHAKKFEFVEREVAPQVSEEPGLSGLPPVQFRISLPVEE